MSKYFIEHDPRSGCFDVWKRSWFFWETLQRSFSYEWNASREQMLQAKKRAQDFIDILKEVE